eukprot:NODE_6591_length_279_cov_199.700000_g5979_i0.p1 GENE.NODE_6591_length_279_cov_199.700000_g5979_i0~~NODE_6591_length_279_cov_199.700000_g5979_i0.p1  ORF type:complete len:66 (+),score=10.70 NODE_6591_length_279_cov_199.700000_g5979_i0:23-199(+)
MGGTPLADDGSRIKTVQDPTTKEYGDCALVSLTGYCTKACYVAYEGSHVYPEYWIEFQ